MQFKRAGKFILNKLQRELPAHLSYHGIDHTLDVYAAAEKIASAEGISSDEKKLLLTAALFHDTGFIKMRYGHEEESCRIVRQYLPLYSYRPAEIDMICSMIMATRVPQSPNTHLEEILCDADLDYLGRDDFFKLSNRLFSELRYEGLIKDESEWDREQADFIEGHHYHTATSVKLRQAKKKECIKLIKSKLNNNTLNENQ
jgi:predicted metal-dependent HD superfamily phosphohydrolase